MDCLRCHGLMVRESFDEVRGDPHDVRFHGWRCVCCGNIIDPVIIRNRTNRSVPILPAASTSLYALQKFGLEAPAA